MLQDFSRRHTQHVIFTPTTLLTLTISLFLWTYYHVFFLSSSRVLGNTRFLYTCTHNTYFYYYSFIYWDSHKRRRIKINES